MAEDKLADIVRVRSNRVYEEIVAQLKRLIAEGKLAPGERLPPERELAERFGVGRNSIREAVRQLELLGLLEARQGEGTFVTEATVEDIATPFSTVLLHTPTLRAEVLDFRRALEPMVAALAAERATAENLARLEQLVTEFEEVVPRPETPLQVLMQLDSQFHYEVAEAAKNGLIKWVMDAVMGLLHEFRQQLFENAFRVQASPAAHRAILEAIKARDARRAQDAMDRHMALLADFLPSQNAEPRGNETDA